jgi:hypothetical protein
MRGVASHERASTFERLEASGPNAALPARLQRAYNLVLGMEARDGHLPGETSTGPHKASI